MMTEPVASPAVEHARAEMIAAIVAAGECIIGLLDGATAEGKAEADRLLNEAKFRGIVLNELLAEEQPHG